MFFYYFLSPYFKLNFAINSSMCIVDIELLQRGQIGAKLSNLTEPGPNSFSDFM